MIDENLTHWLHIERDHKYDASDFISFQASILILFIKFISSILRSKSTQTSDNDEYE